jgi:hypothetical protein
MVLYCRGQRGALVGATAESLGFSWSVKSRNPAWRSRDGEDSADPLPRQEIGVRS